MARVCEQCGHAAPTGANFCQRCGAPLPEATEPERGRTTASFRVEDEQEQGAAAPASSTAGHLVIASGGGRTGESFAVVAPRMSIGRAPDSDVFLDDVTVSRDHALLVQRGGAVHLDDCGSLNGTYVNRRRIESARLQSGDELQIGKYKLTYQTR